MSRSLFAVVCMLLLTATAAAEPPGQEFAPGALPQDNTAGPPPNAMFNVIDADGDGAITMRELRKAVVALKKLDANKDGKITRDETMAVPDGPGGSSGFAGGGGRAGLGSGARFGGNSGGEFASGDPRPGGPNLMKFDRNGDGQLSADEVPTEIRTMLQGADQNRSGTIDAQELQAIQQRLNERTRGQRFLPPGVSVGPQGVSPPPR